jgi:hypothetical protein
VLRAQWQIEEVTAAESISRNWPVYVLGLIGIAGLLALLLPLGGTFWLAQILTGIIQFIYFIIYLILGFFLSMLMGLLPGGAEETPPPRSAPLNRPPLEQAAPPADVAPWLGGTLFWVLMALLLGYAAYIYLSGKGVHFGWLQQWWQRVYASWLLLWQSYHQWRRATAVAADTSEQKEDEESSRRRPFSWLRLRGMDPDQQVRYFYLSMLKQGVEHGIGRRPGETPTRYAPRLEGAIADEEKPVTVLTENFVQVHFAERPIQEESIPYLKALWQRIRKALR